MSHSTRTWSRTGLGVRDQVRVECDIAPRHLTVIEARPPWRADVGPECTRQPIARLRYTKATGTWELFWPDRNSRFHRYDLMERRHGWRTFWPKSNGTPLR